MDWDHDFDANEGVGSDLHIEPGTYPFRVLSVEKEYAKKTNNMMAVLTLEIENDAEEYCNIKDNVVILDSMKWKVRQLHEALGFAKPGEPFKTAWNLLPGSRGHLTIKLEKYTGRDGVERTAPKVDKYLAKDTANEPEDDDCPI